MKNYEEKRNNAWIRYIYEIENTNGGIAPVLIALAWGFGIGFPSGVAIGIAKNV